MSLLCLCLWGEPERDPHYAGSPCDWCVCVNGGQWRGSAWYAPPHHKRWVVHANIYMFHACLCPPHHKTNEHPRKHIHVSRTASPLAPVHTHTPITRGARILGVPLWLPSWTQTQQTQSEPVNIHNTNLCCLLVGGWVAEDNISKSHVNVDLVKIWWGRESSCGNNEKSFRPYR